MQPWFGEFQFAYSCTRELEDGDFHFPGWGMPTIPNLVEEAKLGYDVAFFLAPIAPVFLQFKIANHLTRSNASEWAKFNRDYFRFGVYPKTRSPQHNRLVDLARSGEEVYYCAPAFSTAAEYTAHHSTRSVSDHSVFIDCGLLPKNSGPNRHHIVYTAPGGTAYFLSEETVTRGHTGKRELLSWLRTRARFRDAQTTMKHLAEVLASREVRTYDGTRSHDSLHFQSSVLAEDAMALFGLALGFVRSETLARSGDE